MSVSEEEQDSELGEEAEVVVSYISWSSRAIPTYSYTEEVYTPQLSMLSTYTVRYSLSCWFTLGHVFCGLWVCI